MLSNTKKKSEGKLRYSDLTVEEKKKLLKESLREANKEQKEIVDKYDRLFNAS